MSHPRKRGREVEQRSFPCVPMNPSVLLIKKHKSHSALQLYASLRGVSQLSASYSNPQLLPARNSTVRNLSARRLKPEECYCSGHSCTSTGLATAATVCVCARVGGAGERGGGGRRAGGVEGVKKAILCVSSALRSHDKAAHSWQRVDTFLRPGRQQRSLLPLTPSLFSAIFLQHHAARPTLCLHVSLFKSDTCTQHARSELMKTMTIVYAGKERRI